MSRVLPQHPEGGVLLHTCRLHTTGTSPHPPPPPHTHTPKLLLSAQLQQIHVGKESTFQVASMKAECKWDLEGVALYATHCMTIFMVSVL